MRVSTVLAAACGMMLSGAAFAGITDSRLPQGPSPAPLPDQEPGRAVTYSQGFETVIPAGWKRVPAWPESFFNR